MLSRRRHPQPASACLILLGSGILIAPHISAFVTPTTKQRRCVGKEIAALFLPSSTSYVDEVITFLDNENICWSDLEFGWQTQGGLGVSNRVITLQSPSNIDTNRSRPAVALHLIPSPKLLCESLSPQLTRQMTKLCADPSQPQSDYSLPQQIIHLHEDVWRAKDCIVKKRILARVGRNNSRVYARKTTCRRIDKPTACAFLQENHLWGAVRAKFNYGLFPIEKGNVNNTDDMIEEPREVLVAVAAFGPRRRVKRGGSSDLQSSHELIRFCTRVDGQVLGGLSKLIKHFISCHRPDDIVTVVDRDWGTASGWHQLGFDSVSILPSLAMAVGRDGVRRHLVGAGILPTEENLKIGESDNKGIRPGLPVKLLDVLGNISRDDWQDALTCMSDHGFYPVYDVGVERMVLFTSNNVDLDPLTRWQQSEPKYSDSYYSEVSGIQALLDHAERACLEERKIRI